MANMNRAAIGFADCFPTVVLNQCAFAKAATAFRRGRGAAEALSSFAYALLEDPPVHDLLVPFMHAMLVRAALNLGIRHAEAELIVASLLERIAGETPLAGLRVCVAAPRGSEEVDKLAIADGYITELHAAVNLAGAFCFGPREHPRLTSTDGFSDQWNGHIRTVCEPAYHYDVLLAIDGPSVGLGEAVAISRRLAIPIVSLRLAGDEMERGPLWRPSCRLNAGSAGVFAAIDVSASNPGASEAVVAYLVTITGEIRRLQRERYKLVADRYLYLRYLRGLHPKSATDHISEILQNPMRFIGLGEVELSHLLHEIEALSFDDFELWSRMAPQARPAFDEVAAELSSYERSALLRAGTHEALVSATDRRVYRRQDWSAAETWRRLSKELGLAVT